MKKGNPFTITFGKQPNRMISRYEAMDQIIGTFDSENVVSQTFLIEGIRGSGKTVLMTSTAKQLGDDKDWIVINLNPTMDLLSNFALRLSETCGTKTDVLNRGFNVSAAGFGLGINADEKVDYVGTIDKLFKTIIKKKKRVLITIDEVVHDNNMKIFASQFQIFVRQDYPIFLIMTGLYENIYEIQNDPSLTFLLRAPKIITYPLSLLQISRQYREIFDIDEQKSNELANLTKGYAFAFQALGVCYWENRDGRMEEVLEKFDELLDDFVYRKIWTSLTSKEREIIKATTNGEEKVGEICKMIKMSGSTFSKYRESLRDKGLIDLSKYGYIQLTLPRFFEVARSYSI